MEEKVIVPKPMKVFEAYNDFDSEEEYSFDNDDEYDLIEKDSNTQNHISEYEETISDIKIEQNEEIEEILENPIKYEIGFMTIEEQEKLLNNFIDSVIYKKLIEDRDERLEKSNNDTAALISDTHDDYFSLIGSLIESNIIELKKDEFLYYDIEKSEYLEKEEINEKNRDNNIIVVFLPRIIEVGYIETYHLGDYIDRGNIFESFRCIVFLDYLTFDLKKQNINSLHLAIGNHETMLEQWDDTYRKNLFYIISNMFFDKRISTGYKLNIGGKITALWHSTLNSDRIKAMVNFAVKNIQYCGLNNQMEGLYNNNFSNQLIEKFKEYKKNGNIDIFNEEDIIDIKIGLGNIYLTSFFNTYYPKKQQQIFYKNLNQNFNELEVEIENRGFCNFLFWDDFLGEKEPAVNQIVGHQAYDSIVYVNGLNNTVFDIDIIRSRFYHKECNYNQGSITTVYIDKNKPLNIINDVYSTFYNYNEILNKKASYCRVEKIDIIEAETISKLNRIRQIENYFDENFNYNEEHFAYKQNFNDDMKLLAAHNKALNEIENDIILNSLTDISKFL